VKSAREPILRTIALTAGYGEAPVIEDVDVVAGSGEIVALLGSNGAGKTTVLSAILGLVASTGNVLVDGRDVTGLPPYGRAALGVAWIPEQPRVFPMLTAREHLLLAWENAARPPGALEEVAQHLPMVGAVSDRPAAKLSGGQRKLVLAAAALVQRPRLLLADDPFLGVDADSTALLVRALEGVRSRGGSVLISGQGRDLLASLASRAYLFAAGRIVAEGAPRELLASEEGQFLYRRGSC
jgi:branched-chain amino acid transport system ATP-binding protein